MKGSVSVSACKHPRYSHRVRFPGPGGKRTDRFFTNKSEAESFAKIQRKETGETGSVFGSLSEDERAALAFWRGFLKECGAPAPDLHSVLRNYKAHHDAANASVSVAKGVERFLYHQEAEGSSPRHLASLRSRLGRLSADLGESMVSSITVGEFSAWLNSLRATRADKLGDKLTAVTRHNLSRTIRSFFSFAMERGWTLTNPIPAPKRAKNKASKVASGKAPAVLLPADVARFLKATANVSPGMIPFWAVKFFAGIRDAEAARLEWSMIDLEAGQIHVPANVSKTGEQRTVKILPNLEAWLFPFEAPTGPIAPRETARRLCHRKILAELADKDDDGHVISPFVFPSNAARHSFGTYHLFHFRDAGETALQLGHKSNPAMLHEHYKNPKAERHAPAFWEIYPT